MIDFRFYFQGKQQESAEIIEVIPDGVLLSSISTVNFDTNRVANSKPIFYLSQNENDITRELNGQFLWADRRGEEMLIYFPYSDNEGKFAENRIPNVTLKQRGVIVLDIQFNLSNNHFATHL